MESPKIAQKEPIVMTVEPGTYFWCSCGQSAQQPYCDGSHKGTKFSPVQQEITETKKVAWCACKHGGNMPFCDGAHKNL